MQPELHQNINTNIELKQTLAPQIIQSLDILQLTNLELTEYIEQQLEQNPVLEIADSDDTDNDLENDSKDIENEESFKFENPEKTEYSNNELPSLDNQENFDDDWQERFDDGADYGYGFYNNSDTDDDRDSFEKYTPEKVSLFQHLQKQLLLIFSNNADYQAALYLISNVDEKGFLKVSIYDAAAYCKMSIEKLNEIRQNIMTLDPQGICSLDTREFIMFQLKNKTNINYWTKAAVEKHFDLIISKKIEELARKLRITTHTANEIVSDISKLSAFPLFNFTDDADLTANYIVPDIIYRKINNVWEPFPNNDFIPKIKINQFYKELLLSKTTLKEVKLFLRERITAGENLIKYIKQRESTIMKVARKIAEQQIDFFEKGPQYIKPLILKDIAKLTGFHPSTISRCTNNRYAQTPHGLFELGYFFSSKIETHNGIELSATFIKDKIKNIILNENPDKPISDTDIYYQLIKEGIIINRKTVSNYREALGILPKHLRKKII